MQDLLPDTYLPVASAFLLIGLGMWVNLLLHRDRWVRELKQGAVWLQWRPLPPGLGLSILCAILLGWLVLQMLFQPLLGGVPLQEIPPSLMQALSLATVHLPATLAAFWWIQRHRIPVAEALGLQKPFDRSAWSLGLRAYFFALPVLLLTGILTLALYTLLDRQPEPQYAVASLANVRHPAEIAVIFVLVALVGPFCEEVIFRGVLFPVLCRHMGVWAGLVLHSLIFAAIHMHLPGFLPLFSLSVLLGLVYQRSQNLMSAFALHAVFNAMTLFVFFLGADIGGAP